MFSQFRYLFFSILSGLALGLAWPTDGFTVLIFVALIPLLHLENLVRKNFNSKKALAILGYSYLSFLIWNLITTWWLYNSTYIRYAFCKFLQQFILLYNIFIVLLGKKQDAIT